jgi:Major Facilitator Superfamily
MSLVGVAMPCTGELVSSSRTSPNPWRLALGASFIDDIAGHHHHIGLPVDGQQMVNGVDERLIGVHDSLIQHALRTDVWIRQLPYQHSHTPGAEAHYARGGVQGDAVLMGLMCWCRACHSIRRTVCRRSSTASGCLCLMAVEDPPQPRHSSHLQRMCVPQPSLRELVGIVAALMSVNALAIDTMLAALPAMGVALGVHPATRLTWVVGGYVLGYGVALPIFGMVSDHVGRRRLILGGLAVYVMGSALSAMTSSWQLLVLLRLMQGAGNTGRLSGLSCAHDVLLRFGAVQPGGGGHGGHGRTRRHSSGGAGRVDQYRGWVGGAGDRPARGRDRAGTDAWELALCAGGAPAAGNSAPPCRSLQGCF